MIVVLASWALGKLDEAEGNASSGCDGKRPVVEQYGVGRARGELKHNADWW